MNDRWEEEKQKSSSEKKIALPGVIVLGIVTAAVAGSVIFSFGEGETVTVPSVRQLLEAGEENGGSLNEEPVLAEETETVGKERVKGPLDVSDVVEATMPSIVAITSESVQVVESYFYGRVEIPEESAGSGIIIGENEEELLIATNYHVVEGADSITVCFSVDSDLEDEAIAAARLKGREAAQDLAVVAVSTEDLPEEIRREIKLARIGDSDALVVGERAIAIGNALGYGQSVTAGIISAVNRELILDKAAQKFIQTDAAINFGNSGGALLNEEGQVIGINSAKAAASGVEGMGYAIPINDAKPILETLMNRVTRDKAEASQAGDLGAELRNVSEEAQQLYGISPGAFVYELDSDSPLEKAGIARGDIITEFDGSRVSSAEELQDLLAYYKAGERIEIGYETAGNGAYQERSAEVILAEKQQQQTEKNDLNQSYDFYGNWGPDSWFDSWWGF